MNDTTHDPDCWQRHHECAKAEIWRKHEEVGTLTTQRDALKKALERADFALEDWINMYASELCTSDRAAQARSRIRSQGGTIAYVTDIREESSAALALCDAPSDAPSAKPAKTVKLGWTCASCGGANYARHSHCTNCDRPHHKSWVCNCGTPTVGAIYTCPKCKATRPASAEAAGHPPDVLSDRIAHPMRAALGDAATSLETITKPGIVGDDDVRAYADSRAKAAREALAAAEPASPEAASGETEQG